MNKCPRCGKFLRKVTALLTIEDAIIEVTGLCKNHGEVLVTDWEYWDFFPGADGPLKPKKKKVKHV